MAKDGAKAKTTERTKPSYFPFKVEAGLHKRAYDRADEISVTVSKFLRRRVSDLAALEVSPELLRRAKDFEMAYERSNGQERKDVNFEVDPKEREDAHTNARALGFTLTSYLTECMEDLANADDPSYIAQSRTRIKQAVKRAEREAAKAK
jgi:hypothetical protein